MVDADGRHIPLSGTFNMRDVGGYPAADGRTTRWRTLLRSDTLHRVDAAGPVLAGYGLRTVVDLRTDAEADFAPSPPCGPGTRTVRISLIGDDVRELPQRLQAIYQYLIEQRGDAIAAAIGELCAAGSVPALVHCSAGKDRTGIVIGLILAVLGVPDEVIAADYALSASRIDPQVLATLGHIPGATGRGLSQELLASPPSLLIDVLAWARAAGGTVDGYLIAHGLSREDLDRLRGALTHDGGGGERHDRDDGVAPRPG
jgi:protein-tyrosine phosphatase